jgi:hypothetical protein
VAKFGLHAGNIKFNTQKKMNRYALNIHIIVTCVFLRITCNNSGNNSNKICNVV